MPDTGVVSAITTVADQLGVDPALALAMADQESGLDPYAVGDNGTSYGLYQLHAGGELTDAGLDPNGTGPGSWQDPFTNAMVALGVVKATQARTGLTGGALAAAAQRPADPQGYAASIDARIGAYSSGTAEPGMAGATLAGFGLNPGPLPLFPHLPGLGGGPKGIHPNNPLPGVGNALGNAAGDIGKGIISGIQGGFKGFSHTRAFQQSAQVVLGLVLAFAGFSLLKAELAGGSKSSGWSGDRGPFQTDPTPDTQGADEAPTKRPPARSFGPDGDPSWDDAESRPKVARPPKAHRGRKIAKDAAEAAAA